MKSTVRKIVARESLILLIIVLLVGVIYLWVNHYNSQCKIKYDSALVELQVLLVPLEDYLDLNTILDSNEKELEERIRIALEYIPGDNWVKDLKENLDSYYKRHFFKMIEDLSFITESPISTDLMYQIEEKYRYRYGEFIDKFSQSMNFPISKIEKQSLLKKYGLPEYYTPHNRLYDSIPYSKSDSQFIALQTTQREQKIDEIIKLRNKISRLNCHYTNLENKGLKNILVRLSLIILFIFYPLRFLIIEIPLISNKNKLST